MKVTSSLLICSFLFIGCITKDAPSLGYNLFVDEGVELFTITDILKRNTDPNYRDLEVQFSSVYEDLPSAQKESILQIGVWRNGILDSKFDPDREYFIDLDLVVGSTVCYDFAFRVGGEDYSRKTQHCFVVE